MTASMTYTIHYVGLKNGIHHFDFELNNKFLDIFTQPLVQKMNIQLRLALDKHDNMLELSYKWKGHVEANCDLCNELFDLPIQGKDHMIVKFVSEIPQDADESEIMYKTFKDSSIHVAGIFYDSIMLSLPLRKTHPVDIHEKYTCDPQILKYLEITPAEDEEKRNSIWKDLNLD